MEELSQKGLLAFGSRLFYIAAVFYCDVWRAQSGLSQADGCIFFAGDFAVVCQHCLVFSDFPVVLGTGHSVPFDLDDACADCGVCGVDFCEPQALPAFFSAQESFVYQRGAAHGGDFKEV